MSTQIATGTRLATDIQPEVGRETIWAIDPKHTLVEFTVKHMMFSRVRGRFSLARGVIHCADESDPTRSTVEAETRRGQHRHR
jgi:polyisoprenoid-binding protein YceI